MTNLPEGLSRQIERVSGMMRDAKDLVGTPGVNTEFYVAVCAQSIEEGHNAMGSGDILRMKAAFDSLEEIN